MKMYAFILNDLILLKSLSKEDVYSSVKQDNLVALYDKDNNLIGFNIFNSTYPSLTIGLVFSPKDDLKQYVNNILQKNGFGTINILTPNFVVGKVVECIEHPDSEHLHITKVDIGNEILQIVCGAKNIDQDIKVVVAPLNTMMFDGTIISESVLRNVKSYGMICSGYELNLPQYQKKQGILILDNTYQIGKPYFER